MNGAEYIVEFLRRRGADTVFGYPGAAVIELYDALGKSDIRHILTRHEQGAAHAAVGYAKMSGRPGVCIATSGPGAANLVTGICDANLDSAPLIVITGQVDTPSIGRDAFQEADILGVTIPVTKHSYLVRYPDALKKSLAEAWNIAVTGRPGPVLIDVAHDVLCAELPDDEPEKPVLPRARKNEFPLSERLDAVVSAFEHSYRPLILAGGGVVAGKASEALSIFAQKSGIPIAVTLPGMGIRIPEKYRPGADILGMAGIYGCEAANSAIEQCDLCVAVGCRMSERTIPDFKLFGEGRRIIHCDIDPAELNKNVKVTCPIECGAAEFFGALTSAKMTLKENAIKEWHESLRPLKPKKPLELPPDKISCREILRAVDRSEAVRRDAVYVTDVGNHQMRAAREIAPCFERGFITSAGLGAMGFGLPGAVGASFAVPDGCKRVILLCGDGGFQMTLEELAVLKDTPVPIKIFLFDNSALGMIEKMQQRKLGGRFTDSILLNNPDFSLIAAAYGIDYVRLDSDSRASLDETVNKILDSENNTLVHCLTRGQAVN